VFAALAGMVMLAMTSSAAQQTPNRGITAVPGIRVGQHTLTERPTGCTVILADGGAVGGVDVRGSAPGTRETDLLNPINLVQQVHAIVLSGGSAYGLETATGVMRYLEERSVGFKIGGGVVPIVPAAILFDLGVGDFKIRPDASCGYAAARAATDGPVEEGNVGAGAGATVGKMGRADRAMKGGLGSAAIETPDGLIVGAIAAVNARGDVIDPSTGKVIAGTRTADGRGLADIRTVIRGGAAIPNIGLLENSTIAVVATNAQLTKVQTSKIAQMAHDGFARAIWPVHTMGDGDTIFALATGRRSGAADVDRIGALAADALAEAIVRAVRAAKGIPGYPAASDLR
jgi:L-aminopeptidase/D-esterase-like protein